MKHHGDGGGIDPFRTLDILGDGFEFGLDSFKDNVAFLLSGRLSFFTIDLNVDAETLFEEGLELGEFVLKIMRISTPIELKFLCSDFGSLFGLFFGLGFLVEILFTKEFADGRISTKVDGDDNVLRTINGLKNVG